MSAQCNNATVRLPSGRPVLPSFDKHPPLRMPSQVPLENPIAYVENASAFKLKQLSLGSAISVMILAVHDCTCLLLLSVFCW